MPPNDAPSTIGSTMPSDVAERAHVVAPLRQIPALPGTILASAVAAVVEIDDLGDVGQGGVGGPVDRVVGSRGRHEAAAGSAFPACAGPSRHQLRALDIEEQRAPSFTDTCMSTSPFDERSVVDQGSAACFEGILNHSRQSSEPDAETPVTLLAYSSSQW